MTTLTFPEGFRWGSATAAAQVEGAAFEDGKGPSIWDTMCRIPGAIDDGSNIDVACDHYHRVHDDVQLMKRLRLNTYRFSVSWARVMPDGRTLNEAGIQFYERLIDELEAAGIEPWVTLYHWDLPQPLQDGGGWTNRETAYLFADYARTVYERLGKRSRVWTTLNEPWCSSMLSYVAGEHAPGHTNAAEGLAATHHLLLAHGLAVTEIRKLASELGQHPSLGITLNFTYAHPTNPDSADDRDAARRVNGFQNRLFADPIFKGSYPSDVVSDMRLEADIAEYVQPGDMDTISVPIDVLGVNFYNGCQVAAPADGYQIPRLSPNTKGLLRRSPVIGSANVVTVPRNLEHTAMGWEVNADDLFLLLTWLSDEYTSKAGIPLVVTENGAAYDDHPDDNGFVDDSETRQRYIRDHLAAVHRAIEAGANITGYLVWSLLDNFEWARGYTARFGIVRVDFDTLERIPKASALWFSAVAASGQLSVPEH